MPGTERHITAEIKNGEGAKFNFYKKGYLESMELEFPHKKIRIISLEPSNPGVFHIDKIVPAGDGYEATLTPTIEEMIILYKEAKKRVPEERLTEILHEKIIENIHTIQAELQRQLEAIENQCREL